MKTIIVTISPTGETRLETRGFVGASCQNASKLLEQSLGIRQAERLTAEFHQQQPARQPNRQGT